jgi:uncharacterized membrane protein
VKEIGIWIIVAVALIVLTALLSRIKPGRSPDEQIGNDVLRLAIGGLYGVAALSRIFWLLIAAWF